MAPQMTNGSSQLFASFCFVWILIYYLTGGTNEGRKIYHSLAEGLLGSSKAAVVLTLVLPILLTGTVCSLMLQPRPRTTRQNYSFSDLCSYFISRLLWRKHDGDLNFDVVAFVCIFLPSLIFLLENIHRKMAGADQDESLQMKITRPANSYAILAVMTLTFVLIPVSQQSSILKLVGWSPIATMRIHIWSAVIVIVSGTLHGGLYLFRWFQRGENIMAALTPPSECWTMQRNSDVVSECRTDAAYCSCEIRFRNFLGFSAMLTLLTIGFTSLNFIRRKSFNFFRQLHVILGTLALLCVLLHWSRAIVYLSPGILYYLASTYPVWIESWHILLRYGGTNLVAADIIHNGDEKSSEFVSLTFKATDSAIQQFRPAYFIRLLVPRISRVQHPFSINRLPGESNCVNIIFKVSGPFTTTIATECELNGVNLPPMYLNGYHGTPDRLSQALGHDTLLIIAGGIGITPYLSLLQDFIEVTSSSPNYVDSIKRIELHWICRDMSLFQYIDEHYFQVLVRRKIKSQNHHIQIVFHFTGESTNSMTEEGKNPYPTELASTTTGIPFSPSRFASGSAVGIRSNVPSFIAYVAIVWGGVAVIMFNFFGGRSIGDRVWAPLELIIYSLLVSLLLNLLLNPTLDFAGSHTAINNHSSPRDDLELFDDELGLEMAALKTAGVGFSSSEGVDGNTSHDQGFSSPTISVEKREGRPSISTLMNGIATTRNPGVFTCGPKGLVKTVKQEAGKLGRARRMQVAVHEESFEI